MIEVKKVLFVDADETVQNTIKKGLSRQNFEVYAATDCEKALHFIKDEKPDLVITDYKMPQMNGIELIKEAIQLDSSAGYILFTGNDITNEMQEAMNVGMIWKYIKKPQSARELKAVIEEGFIHFPIGTPELQ
ncbi:MAG: response regulator [Candidatus Brocadiaceae bacterium]|nr:response regulator [Candidatus Brocadiaceae bacterium]